MRALTLLAFVSVFTLFADATSGQISGRFDSIPEYGDLVIVLDEPSFLTLDAALVNATLKQIPLTELIGEDVDADSFASFDALFQYVDSGQTNQLGRPARLVFSYRTDLKQVDPRAIWQRLLEKLVERLSRTMERLEGHSQTQQEVRQEMLKRLLDDARMELDRAMQRYVEAQAQDTTSAEAVRHQRQQLRAQRQELEMKIAAGEARKEAVAQQIALLKDQGRSQPADDEIAQQLTFLVEVAESEVEKLKEAARVSGVTEWDVRRAEGEVAKARIDLLRHRSGEQNATVSKQIASLNEQLTAATIDLAESRNLLQFVEQRWARSHAELASHLLLEGRLQTIEAELAQGREQVQQLQTRLREVESAIQPRSTVRIVPWNE